MAGEKISQLDPVVNALLTDVFPSVQSANVDIKTTKTTNQQLFNLFNTNNLLSPYIVGTDTDIYLYTSVQAANDQAVADGHDAANPAIIYVAPGNYSEDYTPSPGIYLAALGQIGLSYSYDATINIIGNTVIDCTFTAMGINFASGNSDPAFSVTGSDLIMINLVNSSVDGGDSALGVHCDNPNTFIYSVNGSLSAAPGNRALYIEAGSFVALGGVYNAQGVLYESANAGNISFFNSYINCGNGNFISGNLVWIENCYLSGSAAHFVRAGAGMYFRYVQLDNFAGGGYFVTGEATGLVLNGGVTCGYNSKIDPVLTIIPFKVLSGPVSFDGGETFFTPGGLQESGYPASALEAAQTNPAQYDNITSSSGNNTRVFLFDPTTQEFVGFRWPIPKRWNKGPVKFKVEAIANNADVTKFASFLLQGVARGINSGNDLGFGSAQAVTLTGSLIAYSTMVSDYSDAITIANVGADSNSVEFRLARDPSISDDITVDVGIVALTLQWTAIGENDA